MRDNMKRQRRNRKKDKEKAAAAAAASLSASPSVASTANNRREPKGSKRVPVNNNEETKCKTGSNACGRKDSPVKQEGYQSPTLQADKAPVLDQQVVAVEKALENQIEKLMEADLMCQICHDIYVNPIILSCAHSFCKFCINEWLSVHEKCPFCRADVHFGVENLAIKNVLTKMTTKSSKDFQNQRKTSVSKRVSDEESQAKKKMRVIFNQKTGAFKKPPVSQDNSDWDLPTRLLGDEEGQARAQAMNASTVFVDDSSTGSSDHEIWPDDILSPMDPDGDRYFIGTFQMIGSDSEDESELDARELNQFLHHSDGDEDYEDDEDVDDDDDVDDEEFEGADDDDDDDDPDHEEESEFEIEADDDQDLRANDDSENFGSDITISDDLETSSESSESSNNFEASEDEGDDLIAPARNSDSESSEVDSDSVESAEDSDQVTEMDSNMETDSDSTSTSDIGYFRQSLGDGKYWDNSSNFSRALSASFYDSEDSESDL